MPAILSTPPNPATPLDIPRSLPSRVDVLVVGARAAGAATARLLARAGLDVLAVDRGAYGGDTLSTHALMRGGVLQLARWGLLDRLRATGVPPVRRSTFFYGETAVPLEIRPRDGISALYGPRRTVLDALLVDAAREAGARVEYGLRFAGLTRDRGGRVSGAKLVDGEGREREVRAAWVVGADGIRSAVARGVAAPTLAEARHATGTLYGYFEGLVDDGYDWRYVPGASIGVIPTHDRASCVFVSVSSERFARELAGDVEGGFERVVGEVAPGFARELAAAKRVGGLRGFPGVPGYRRRPWGPGWALVGDAAHFKDPITAHGLTDALRDAEGLARALVAGTEHALANHAAESEALSRPIHELSEAIAAYDWDLERIAALHRDLAAAMKAEVAAILAWDVAPPFAACGLPERRTA